MSHVHVYQILHLRDDKTHADILVYFQAVSPMYTCMFVVYITFGPQAPLPFSSTCGHGCKAKQGYIHTFMYSCVLCIGTTLDHFATIILYRSLN